jgi:hypothetical protein
MFPPPLLAAAGSTTVYPPGMGWLRVTSDECKCCLKECVGEKIQQAQASAARIQAPMSLVTWYLFRNKPFQMWPLEDALGALVKRRGVFGAGAVASYFSCRDRCELDCPYPGGSPGQLQLPELDRVDASDTTFLGRLYQRGARTADYGGGGGGGGGGGSFADAVSSMFQVV